jgi:ribosome-interacting GTPase 1
MPANLTPQYAQAEEEYKKAQSTEEKLTALKKMYSLMPKHKGTEKLQAELKSKMKELKEEAEHEKKSGKKGVSYKIPKQGAGQVILLGGPNVGKSRLLSRLTKATPEVAAYPFTTREPHPGMMAWEDVYVQLIDTPPITPDYMEGYLSSMARGADAAALMVDLGDDDGISAAEALLERLAQTKTLLSGPDDWKAKPADAEEEHGVQHVKTLLVANKIDLPDADVRLELVKEHFGKRFSIHVISAEHGQGLEDLRNAIYRFLNVIRVYTKQPGKPPDMSAPFSCPAGCTLLEMAALVHRDFADKLKHARIWGTGVYDGQTVKRDHVMQDKDVVELHI